MKPYSLLICKSKTAAPQDLEKRLGDLGLPLGEVFTAETGQAALRRFRAHPTDLVVTAARLPDMGGRELLTRIQAVHGDVQGAVLPEGDAAPEALMRLLSESIETLRRRRARGPRPEQDAVLEAVAYMEKNYQKPLTLTILANVVSLNYTYFSSIFKKRMGVSVIAYLQGIRIRKAKELLLDTREKIGGVARRAGFTDERYFGKVFKQYEGVTPSAFRRTHGNTEEP